MRWFLELLVLFIRNANRKLAAVFAIAAVFYVILVFLGFFAPQPTPTITIVSSTQQAAGVAPKIQTSPPDLALLAVFEVVTGLRSFCLIVMVSSLTSAIGKYIYDRPDHESLIQELSRRFVIKGESNGLVQVHPKLDLDNILRQTMRGDVLKIFTTWQVHFQSPTHFERWIDMGVNVELLMLKDDSQYIAARAKEIEREDVKGGIHIRLIEQELNALKKKMAKLGGAGQGTITIRFYDGLCPCPIYLIVRDKKPRIAWTGFYLKKSDDENLYLEWAVSPHEANPFVTGLLEYFKHKWDGATPA